MSIYATLWELKFPLFGQSHANCEWETVLAQGVPEHIGEEGEVDYLAFLPPRVESIQDGLRAVVFIRARQPKGTERSAQEYLSPLLMLTGKEYASIPFPRLHEKLAEALRGSNPRVTLQLYTPDGSVKVAYEDRTTKLAQEPSDA